MHNICGCVAVAGGQELAPSHLLQPSAGELVTEQRTSALAEKAQRKPTAAWNTTLRKDLNHFFEQIGLQNPVIPYSLEEKKKKRERERFWEGFLRQDFQVCSIGCQSHTIPHCSHHFIHKLASRRSSTECDAVLRKMWSLVCITACKETFLLFRLLPFTTLSPCTTLVLLGRNPSQSK